MPPVLLSLGGNCQHGFEVFCTFATELHYLEPLGGARRDRTADLLRAKQALSHLSYGPVKWIPKFRIKNLQNYSGCSIGEAKHINNMRVSAIGRPGEFWWVWEDLNFRPHPYQGCALTN